MDLLNLETDQIIEKMVWWEEEARSILSKIRKQEVTFNKVWLFC